MLSKIIRKGLPVLPLLFVLIVIGGLYVLRSKNTVTKDAFDLWSGLATLSGFAFTLLQHALQVRDAKAQSEKFQEKFREVQEALSTRYIGTFPGFVDNVTSMIKQAQNEIIMFVDFPAYSCFSDPKGWLEHTYAVRDKLLADVSVVLICQSESMRARRVAAQFPDSTWATKKADASFNEKLLKYCRQHNLSAPVNTVKELSLLLEEDDKQALKDFKQALVHEIQEDIPLFFWIIDNKHAVFAIPGYTDQSIEHGFETTDGRLIKALLEIKEKYCSPAHSPTLNSP